MMNKVSLLTAGLGYLCSRMIWSPAALPRSPKTSKESDHQADRSLAPHLKSRREKMTVAAISIAAIYIRP